MRCTWPPKIGEMFFPTPTTPAGTSRITLLDDVVIGTAVNTTSEVAILTAPFAADAFEDGDVLTIEQHHQWINTAGAVGYTVRVRFGGVLLMEVASSLNATSALGRFARSSYSVSRIGSTIWAGSETGGVNAWKYLGDPFGVASFNPNDTWGFPGNRSTGPFDFTIANDLTVTMQMDTASPDASIATLLAKVVRQR